MATEREAQLLLNASAAGIKSPDELANFMAQISQESGGLTKLDESFRYPNGVPSGVKSALREGREVLETARVEALHGKPEKLAELMYGGRMGNDQPGDGYKYHGRGYIQLTGKNEYSEAGKALQLDLVGHPELAAQPENASKIATFYWNQNVHAVAPEDVTRATHIINGGEIGLAERKAHFAEWQKTLAPDVMTHLANGEMTLPITVETPHHASASHNTAGTLKSGDYGVAVGAVQQQLRDLGYTDAHGNPVKVDSDYGRTTEAVVKAFQTDHGLITDGRIGPTTQQHLDATVRDKQIAGMAPATNSQLRDFSDPSHPQNATYCTLKDLLPPGTSQERLAQGTAACHLAKIGPNDLSGIYIGDTSVQFTSRSFLAMPAQMDISQPAPPLQQSVQQVQQYNQQQAQINTQVNAQIQAQNAQAPPGPVLGGPPTAPGGGPGH